MDLIYYGHQGQLEYDFVVAPGTDPTTITLGVKGADILEVDAQGDLVLQTASGELRQAKPVVYQEVDGVRREIAGWYVLRGEDRVGVQVGAYDPARPLVIDPVLFYATYLGTSGQEQAGGIAVDPAGNAYVTGFTDSPNFPTTAGAFDTTQPGGRDAFVTKLNPTGSALVYSTYLGGNGNDEGHGIAVDILPNPNAYVSGVTESADFPATAGAFDTTFGGFQDGFVAKIIDVVLPPPPLVAKVTGGGSITVQNGIGTFGFIVQRQTTTGPISGDLQYVNHASGAKVHSVTFTILVVTGNTATFGGTCTNNGVPCTFSVEVEDNGEPGKDDIFTISVSAGLEEGGTLRSGNIQIHD